MMVGRASSSARSDLFSMAANCQQASLVLQPMERAIFPESDSRWRSLCAAQVILLVDRT
jgi:hypothetical protein